MDIGLKHLFLAFAAVWALLFGYAWSLARRQEKLAEELRELRRTLSKADELVEEGDDEYAEEEEEEAEDLDDEEDEEEEAED